MKHYGNRMPRIEHFTTADGRKRPNTGRPLAPFRLMKTVGDYFEVPAGECLAGNLTALATLHGQQMGVRFSFRAGPRVHRVTLVSLTRD